MKSIKNNKYWIGIFLGLLFSLTILIAILFLYVNDVFLQNGKIIIPILLIAYGTFIFFFFRKLFQSQIIELSNNGIHFIKKNEIKKIGWSEISDIDYYGRNGFLGTETIKINKKKSRNPILIYHSHFSNSNVITQAIKYCFESCKSEKKIDLKAFSPIIINTVSKDKTKFGKFNYISRTPLAAFNSYVPLLGIFGIYKLVNAEFIQVEGVISISILILLTFLVGILRIGRIGISENYLISEHYYLPISKVFRLIDIQEVFIENPELRSPSAIRIVTKNGKQKTITIANFLRKDWSKLDKILKENNITVINTLENELNKA